MGDEKKIKLKITLNPEAPGKVFTFCFLLFTFSSIFA